MTDIVERLHRPLDTTVVGPEEIAVERREAAEEIERLRALSQNNAKSWDAIVRERDELRAELMTMRSHADENG